MVAGKQEIRKLLIEIKLENVHSQLSVDPFVAWVDFVSGSVGSRQLLNWFSSKFIMCWFRRNLLTNQWKYQTFLYRSWKKSSFQRTVKSEVENYRKEKLSFLFYWKIINSKRERILRWTTKRFVNVKNLSWKMSEVNQRWGKSLMV